MATNAQLAQFSFAGGIDQSRRRETTDPNTSALNLENVRQLRRGGVGKRYGFSNAGRSRQGGTERSAGKRIVTDDATTYVIDGSVVDVYDAAAGNWRTVGRVPEMGATYSDLPAAGVDDTPHDAAYTGGYVAYAAGVDSGGTVAVYATIVHASTGAIVLGPTSFGTASLSAVGAISGYFLLAINAGTSIKVYSLEVANLGAGWTLLETVTVTTNATLAACSLTDRVAFAYGVTSGTDRVVVRTYSGTAALQSTTIGTSSTTPGQISIDGISTDTLWVAWPEGTAVKACGLSPSSLSTVLASTVTAFSGSTIAGAQICASSTAGKARVCANDLPAGSHYNLMMRGLQTSGGAAATDGSTITVYNATIASRPFERSGRYYIAVRGPQLTTTQRDVVVVDWTDDVQYLRPVAHPYPDLIPLVSSSQPYAKMAQGADADERYWPIAVTRSAAVNAAKLAKLTFGDSRQWLPVSFGNSLYLSGGLTHYLDGVRASEVGFVWSPTQPTVVASGTGITLSTGRRYVAIFEDIDADGNWIVSGISTPSDATGAISNKTLTITTRTLAVTTRATSPTLRIAFYATLDGAVPPYFRLTSVANDTTAQTVSVTDSYTGSGDTLTLGANAKLYAPNLPGTVGEALDRRGPPGMMQLAAYNGMLVGAVGGDVFFSGQLVSGEGAWFNPVFQFPVPGEGDITGLIEQDGTLYVFRRREIAAVSGEPPSDNGAVGGFGTVRSVNADVGCIDSRTLLSTEIGTFFQSDRGIELLTRGQSVEWIGEPVRDTVESYSTCKAATLDAPAGRVYFEMTDGANGRTLVFNLTLRIWESIDRRTDAEGTIDAAAESASIVYDGSAWRYAWLSSDGRVYVESRATHLDPESTWVTMRAEMSWLKAAGLQGMQQLNRMLFLGQKETAHDLSFAMAYDYDDTYKAARTLSATAIDSLVAALPNQQIQISPDNDARCEAVRVKITDATPTSGSVGTGQGSTWVGLTYEIAPAPHAYRLPDLAR